MTQLNKLRLASLMLMESHERYISATREIDYIVSILLSGAVGGIIAPLLKENDRLPTYSLFAAICNSILDPGEKKSHESLFREPYNSLKHAGGGRRDIDAWSDLTCEFDLRAEAKYSLFAARQDFDQLRSGTPFEVMEWSQDFLEFLDLDHDYDTGKPGGEMRWRSIVQNIKIRKRAK